MNTIPQEQLFTDLTPEQAETITAAATGSAVNTSFGSAGAVFARTGKGQFEASLLNVNDKLKDGNAVYAKFQGRATDGSILTTSTKRFDRNGAGGGASSYKNLSGSFSKEINQLRVAVYRQDSGADSVVAGNWANI